MNTLLSIIEGATTYQDYVWFLAAFAWLAVAFGVRRREETEQTGHDQTWLAVLALSAIVGATLELALCAQNLIVPYTKFDFGMGFAQAVGIAALSWPALEQRWSE